MLDPRAVFLVVLGLVSISLGCTVPEEAASGAKEAETMSMLDRAGESYVKLVLEAGRHVDDYVDAYYGPEQWKEAVEAETSTLQEIRQRAAALIEEIDSLELDETDELLVLRRRYLSTQLKSLVARIDIEQGTKMTFDEESRALYDAVAPTHSEEHFQRILDELAPLLPGEGSPVERYDAFKREFIIPRDRLEVVFDAAISACRERTRRHLDLPPDESFEIEYVTDKPWSAYNWYQGGFHSLIQVNTDLPIYIDRAVDLACHEGYPGHHVYNCLLEKHLVRDRGWVEFSIYALFSAQSLIAEGTADYGIDVAFPGEERIEFERDTLFPLAGLDPGKAERFYRVQKLVQKLGYAGNEAARRYIDGEIDATAASEWLSRYALMPPARAEQRVRFVDRYRSYVINYNLGHDLVRRYVEARSGDDPRRIWDELGLLLSSPRLPSGLR